MRLWCAKRTMPRLQSVGRGFSARKAAKRNTEIAASLYARSAGLWAMPDRPQRITAADMRNIGMRRAMRALLCLVLGACSSDKIDIPPAF